MPRKPRPNKADALLPHLGAPIDAYTLAKIVGSTYTGCESALKGMQRRGLVRKIVRRQGGQFIAHQWQAVARDVAA